MTIYRKYLKKFTVDKNRTTPHVHFTLYARIVFYTRCKENGGKGMRTYNIYIIENEFALHYYGREYMFFNLFSDYEKSDGEVKKILRRQINFVTRKVPGQLFNLFMDRQLKENPDCYLDNGVYYIRKKTSGHSEASLAYRNHSLILHADGTYECETIFFEWLRQWNPYFLALDTTQDRCAWLRPIKQRLYV